VRAFAAAGVAWNPVIEARGWELALHFAQLGLGLAIVNDFCRTPPGLVMRPLKELAPVTYRLLRLRGRRLPKEAKVFEQLLVH
jgi:DNA-binding transcriptional LysR family regulator